MKESQSELTSALLDGELDAQTGDRLVSRMLQEDPSEIERFGRYRLIGDVLRGEASVNATAVSAAVSAALESEPTILAPPRRKPTWVRPLTGIALAASVAAAAIVIAPQLMTSSPQAVSPTTIAAQPSPRLMEQPRLVAAGSGLSTERATPQTPAPRWQTLDKTLEDRLNQLVIEHHEFGGRTGVNGPVAHIGLVSYDDR